MNRFVFRSKAMLLLALLAASTTVEVSPIAKNILIGGGILFYDFIRRLTKEVSMSNNIAKDLQPYSNEEKDRVRDIISPYVTDESVLTDILFCLRKPQSDSLKEIGPCALGNMVIIDPTLLIDQRFTDIEFAYYVLHEYGHVIHSDCTMKTIIINGSMAFVTQMALVIILQKYMSNVRFKIFYSWVLAIIGKKIVKTLLRRNEEYHADDYAFNALGKSAPIGVQAIEESYKELFRKNDISFSMQKMTYDPSLIDRATMTVIDSNHPTVWARYQHACKVAKKYGWTPEAVVA